MILLWTFSSSYNGVIEILKLAFFYSPLFKMDSCSMESILWRENKLKQSNKDLNLIKQRAQTFCTQQNENNGVQGFYDFKFNV